MGPIVIGSNCIIEESVIIVNRCALLDVQLSVIASTDTKRRRKEVMGIGDDNLFEIGCREYGDDDNFSGRWLNSPTRNRR